MKKAFKIGFLVSLLAILPAANLFAGDGDGKDKKRSVSMRSGGESGLVTFHIYSTTTIDINAIEITPRNPGASIKEINPVVGGIDVVIDFVPVTNYDGNPNNDDVIVFDIVGVDNITGVDGSNNNTGTHFGVNIFETADGNGTTNNNGAAGGSFSSPTNSTNTFTSFTATKSDISVYPNPVITETNVVTVGEILGRTIDILDLSGKSVLTIVVTNKQTTLDLSDLNPGLYILNYKTSEGKVISKRIQKV